MRFWSILGVVCGVILMVVTLPIMPPLSGLIAAGLAVWGVSLFIKRKINKEVKVINIEDGERTENNRESGQSGNGESGDDSTGNRGVRGRPRGTNTGTNTRAKSSGKGKRGTKKRTGKKQPKRVNERRGEIPSESGSGSDKSGRGNSRTDGDFEHGDERTEKRIEPDSTTMSDNEFTIPSVEPITDEE